jgi:DNA polymerase V
MTLLQRTLRQRVIFGAPSPPACDLRLLAHPMSAGFPSPAADEAEKGLDLNDYLIRNKPATFLFTVRGDSMIGASIEDGDQVIVDRSLTPRSNDIVVAVVAGEYTLKRLRLFAQRAELHAENPRYPPILIGEGGELQIWGVVAGLVRRYGARR